MPRKRRMFGRQPTDWERVQIALLLQAAGGQEELCRWVKAEALPPRRKRGRPAEAKFGRIDSILLLRANDYFRDRSGSSLSVSGALGKAIDDFCSSFPHISFGQSKAAAVRRLLARLRPPMPVDLGGLRIEGLPGIYSHLHIARGDGRWPRVKLLVRQNNPTKKK